LSLFWIKSVKNRSKFTKLDSGGRGSAKEREGVLKRGGECEEEGAGVSECGAGVAGGGGRGRLGV
jgi:hypothetical protein